MVSSDPRLPIRHEIVQNRAKLSCFRFVSVESCRAFGKQANRVLSFPANTDIASSDSGLFTYLSIRL